MFHLLGENMRTKSIIFLVILLVLYFLSYIILFVFPPDTVNALIAEDHLYENIQACGDLFVSLVFLFLFIKDKSGNDFYKLHTRKNIFFISLALIFFFGFGEEISWGQRIFNWSTPDSVAQINEQHETNIHNLDIFTRDKSNDDAKLFSITSKMDFSRIFSLFWFTFCFVIPVLDKLINPFSKWIRKLNFPIVPIWLGVLFPLNYLTYKGIELYFMNSLWHNSSEVKETVFAFLFVAVSIYLFTEFKRNRESDLERLSGHLN